MNRVNGSTRPEALTRLDVLVGEWTVHAEFPGDGPKAPPGRSVFDWTLDGRSQRTEVPLPEAPASISPITGSAEATGATESADSPDRTLIRRFDLPASPP